VRPFTIRPIAAGVLVTLAVSLPVCAQGKSGQAHGKTPAPQPATMLPPATSATAQTQTASPFAWMDDANLVAPRTVWLGVSMMRWQGSGVGETIVPIVDAAIGITPRMQIAASVPRIDGGVGTTFFSAKIAAFADSDRGFKVALAPTLEVLSRAAVLAGPAGQSRAQWGLPVSMELDGESGRYYGSSGYFSPGIWYAGAGAAAPIANRVSVSLSYSRAWATMAKPVGAAAIAGPHRNEVSGGGSFDLTPGVSVFGALSRTIGVAADAGAGTTISFGLSLTAGPLVSERH
jgi:hypothetical protein